MSKVIMLLLLTLSLSAKVDIIINSFEDYDSAKIEQTTLKEFAKSNNLTATNINIKKIGGTFYLEIGTFSDSIRDDEKLLALLSSRYPNIVLVPHKEEPTKSNRVSKTNQYSSSSSIFGKYEATIQWILILIMTIWGGIILYLRFKKVKTVKDEQTLIKREQDDMEISLRHKEEF